MAKVSAKGAVILVDDTGGNPRDISADVLSYSIQYSNDTPEVTGFGDGSHNFVVGQVVRGVSLDVLWNNAVTTGAFTVLKAIAAGADTVTVKITPEVGAEYFSGEFICQGIEVSGSASGDPIKLGSVNFVVSGAVSPGWTST
jgi:hypothetical protein